MLFATAGWEFLQALKLMIGLEQSALNYISKNTKTTNVHSERSSETTRFARNNIAIQYLYIIIC